MKFQFSLPEAVMQRVGSTTLSVSTGGTALGSATYNKPGEYTYTVAVPASAFGGEAVTFDFALDKFLAAGTADERELGLVAAQISVESK